jgi:hypothetical protein
MLLTEITDDDGILVLASATGLRRRFADREFDYDYPTELLEGAHAEEICAWETGEEGIATLRLHPNERPPALARFVGVLRIAPKDTLLVLPYSQYTFACSERKGEPQQIDALCGRFAIAEGRYACWISTAQDKNSLTFDVFLVKATDAEQPLKEIPTFLAGQGESSLDA